MSKCFAQEENLNCVLTDYCPLVIIVAIVYRVVRNDVINIPHLIGSRLVD